MHSITTSTLTALFNGSAEHRRICGEQAFIHVETSSDCEVSFNPKTPESFARYLSYLVSPVKHGLFENYAVGSLEHEAPITVVFHGVYTDPETNKKYGEVPLLTLKYGSKTEGAQMIMDEYYQEANPNVLPLLEAVSKYQLMSALTQAGRNWKDVSFNLDKQDKTPKLQVVR